MTEEPTNPEPDPAPEPEPIAPPPARTGHTDTASPNTASLGAGRIETGYTDAGVPTLEGVREKIESRYGAALGAAELAEETPEGRAAAEQYETRRKAAAEKLEEIRASMQRED